jgi:hypothetical protein
MNVPLDQYLQLVALHDGRIVDDKNDPWRHLTPDMFPVIGADGNQILVPGLGVNPARLSVPSKVLRELIDRSYVEEDRAQEAPGRVVFRLTEDGRKAGQIT